MLDVLLNMLIILGIIVVGCLILAVAGVAIYAILYVIYKFFISKRDNGNGRR